ncbi:MAG: radical SAM protein [Planctomycetaceae bacterium]|jgi:radical SAM protein with 4Fe4S-binding SPASM domain|nr:radical SAM protein [Planctomycetaceae bacterium]
MTSHQINYKPHILSQNRTPLQSVIPLSAPYTVLFEVSRLCNLKCIFCPQSEQEHFRYFDANLMTWNSFEKSVQQLGHFSNKIKKVYMHGTGESTLNPQLPEMIQFLKYKNVTDSIDLTTNGLLLSEQLGQSLVSAGLNHLHISVEALSSQGYQNITGRDIDFDKFVGNIRTFSTVRENCRLTIKIADISVKTQEEKDLFFEIFSPLCDEIFIENIYPIWPSYGQGEKLKQNQQEKTGQYGQPIVDRMVCPQIFTQLAVKCDGSVSPCSVDWDNENVLGNIHCVTLYEMWNGSRLKEIRMKHLKSSRHNMVPCQRCGLPKYSCIDNLDNFRQELIEKIDI